MDGHRSSKSSDVGTLREAAPRLRVLPLLLYGVIAQLARASALQAEG